jgi:energy-coupling factor transporter ATP-binding protein EcfA2
MQIKQISVTGLFGIFDHVIPLNMDDRITIVHGPNGFGKTAMLRLLNGFFNSRYSVFRKIPFSHFQILLSNDDSIDIFKTTDKLGEDGNKENITFTFRQPTQDSPVFSLTRPNTPAEINPSLEALSVIPDLQRIEVDSWIYYPTNERLSLNEVLDRFEEILPSGIKLKEEPKWLEKIKKDVQIRFIESQRLLNISQGSYRIHHGVSPMLPTVSAYSNEVAHIMRSKFTEYGVISQSLDRTFPSRLVQGKSSHSLTTEQLLEKLNQIELTRSRLIKIGLLDNNENSDFPIQPPAIDESTKNILSVYVEDVEKKLSVFNDVASKIDLLRKIINSKFSYKEMSFNKDKGFVFKTLYNSSVSNSDTLSPTDLSSGEQHELVLLYELLFKVEPKSLVLIDEPELSLHVGWQVQFLKDLQDIVKLADLDILMATHSPDIIQDRWDLTVELQGMKK